MSTSTNIWCMVIRLLISLFFLFKTYNLISDIYEKNR